MFRFRRKLYFRTETKYHSHFKRNWVVERRKTLIICLNYKSEISYKYFQKHVIKVVNVLQQALCFTIFRDTCLFGYHCNSCDV